MQINNHCVFRGKKKWKPFLLPVSCSDLSKSCTWALVLHKIAALQIKATGANKGHSLIVLLRPVMSVFFEHTHTLVSLYEWCFRFAHFDQFLSLWNSKGYLNLSLTGFTIFVRTFWKKLAFTTVPVNLREILIWSQISGFLCVPGNQYRSTSSHSISLLNGDMILTKSSPRHVT